MSRKRKPGSKVETSAPDARAAQAAERYCAGIRPDAPFRTSTRMQQEMVRRYLEHAAIQDRLDRAAQAVTDPAGVPTIRRIWYKTFGRQVSRLWRRRNHREYQAELALLREKWRIRGLEPELLERVQQAVIAELEEK